MKSEYISLVRVRLKCRLQTDKFRKIGWVWMEGFECQSQEFGHVLVIREELLTFLDLIKGVFVSLIWRGEILKLQKPG